MMERKLLTSAFFGLNIGVLGAMTHTWWSIVPAIGLEIAYFYRSYLETT